MKILFKMILALLCGAGLDLLLLYGVDRHIASREHADGLEAVDCVFENNCKFYNDQMKGDFFRG